MVAMPTDNFVKLNGLQFHYRDWGGKGVPLILLHGLASNAVFWDLAAPYLSRHFRTFALDQRGHGSSAKPDDGYDFPSVSADVEAFTRALGLEKPIVAGHSWGGNVAIQVAADYPQLPFGIVCIDGGIIEPSSEPGATWEETAQTLAPPDFEAMNLTWEQFLERARDWGAAINWGDKIQTFLKANFEVNGDGRVRPRLTRERHMRILKEIWNQRVSGLYPSVSCSVLIMPARKAQLDASSRLLSFNQHKEAAVAKASQSLKRSRTVWMEDSIHDVPVQRPKEVAQVIIQAHKEGFFSD